jgi:hypothetical protein
LAETRSDLRAESTAAHAETRRHFDVTAEASRHQVERIAENAASTREALDQIHAKIERTAAETQAMIKFSHAELDKRVRALEYGQRTLEETVAELQARVDRIESSAH